MAAIPQSGRVVLALHGFTLGGEMFDEMAELVAADVVAPDLPGHGGRNGTGTSWGEAVAEVQGLIIAHRPQVIVGYSMGGRLALAAVLDGGTPQRLVAVSSGLGLATTHARDRRRAEDEALAGRLEASSVEDFIAEWERAESVGGHGELAAIRRRNTVTGLAAALRGMGQGSQPYLGGRLGELQGASVWMAGAADPKYLAIAERAAAAASAGEAVIVPGARHNVIAAAPGAVAAVVNRLLR